MTNTPSKISFAGLTFGLVAYMVFSTHDAIVKSLQDYSIFQIIFFAMLFGYVPFSVVRIFDRRPQTLLPSSPTLVALHSVLTVVNFLAAFIAFTTAPLVEVYVLLFLTPSLISIFAIKFLNEKIHLPRWIAIFMGLVGALIILRPSTDSISMGHVFALIAAFCSAGRAILSRKLRESENSATMILAPLIASILVTGVGMLFAYKPMPLDDLLLIFLIGVLSLLGQYLLLKSYHFSQAAFVAPLQYSQLIWASIFGYFFFNEVIDRYVIIGGLVTVASGVLIVWRESKVSTAKPNLSLRNKRMMFTMVSMFREREVKRRRKEAKQARKERKAARSKKTE